MDIRHPIFFQFGIKLSQLIFLHLFEILDELVDEFSFENQHLKR